ANADVIEAQELEAFFKRLEATSDHYEVLDVGRVATADEIKNAYHALALRFHPDRFHRSAPELRDRVHSAFARIAQAYELLTNDSLRATYDKKHKGKSPQPETSKRSDRASTPATAVKSEAKRAEASFQMGLNLSKQ